MTEIDSKNISEETIAEGTKVITVATNGCQNVMLPASGFAGADGNSSASECCCCLCTPYVCVDDQIREVKMCDFIDPVIEINCQCPDLCVDGSATLNVFEKFCFVDPQDRGKRIHVLDVSVSCFHVDDEPICSGLPDCEPWEPRVYTEEWEVPLDCNQKECITEVPDYINKPDRDEYEITPPWCSEPIKVTFGNFDFKDPNVDEDEVEDFALCACRDTCDDCRTCAGDCIIVQYIDPVTGQQELVFTSVGSGNTPNCNVYQADELWRFEGCNYTCPEPDGSIVEIEEWFLSFECCEIPEDSGNFRLCASLGTSVECVDANNIPIEVALTGTACLPTDVCGGDYIYNFTIPIYDGVIGDPNTDLVCSISLTAEICHLDADPPLDCECPPPEEQGACCIGEGDDKYCQQVTEDYCESLNGEYFGDGTDCNVPNICDGEPPVGACCDPAFDGTCYEVTFVECEDVNGINGIWQGVDPDTLLPYPCDTPFICDDPNQIGACCYLDEMGELYCDDTASLFDCREGGGIWTGVNQCDWPEICEEGSCCVPPGLLDPPGSPWTCVNHVDEVYCTAVNGVFHMYETCAANGGTLDCNDVSNQ